MISDAVNAISILSVFLASGARIAPAMLRLQQSFAVYRSSSAAANLTLDLAESVKNEEENFSLAISTYNNNFKNFEGDISITNLDFVYPESNEFALSDINLDIEQGMFIALVGPSGAGKTSLVDVILGITNPSKGKVLISGLPPRESIKKWPGSIAYVPQDVNIVNGTIKENIILGFGANEVPDEEITAVLLKSNLSEFINRLPNGLNTMTGERGLKLSGGQKQKVAFARALITNPKVIVLDEATSALDAESEREITDFIVNLKGSKTIIVIAHRLASVQSADKVVYMSEGKILATGKFADVRSKIKDFDNQAKIMGL
jgi:ABC-type multidrug transport system fused ATPase/permease subunit